MSSEYVSKVKQSNPKMCAVNEFFDATNANPFISLTVVPGLLSVLWGVGSAQFGNRGADTAITQGLWSEVPVVGPIVANAFDQALSGESISYSSGCKSRYHFQ